MRSEKSLSVASWKLTVSSPVAEVSTRVQKTTLRGLGSPEATDCGKTALLTETLSPSPLSLQPTVKPSEAVAAETTAIFMNWRLVKLMYLSCFLTCKDAQAP